MSAVTIPCFAADQPRVHQPRSSSGGMRMNKADTCRKFVVPKLQAAGQDFRPHAINEQRTFTD